MIVPVILHLWQYLILNLRCQNSWEIISNFVIISLCLQHNNHTQFGKFVCVHRAPSWSFWLPFPSLPFLDLAISSVYFPAVPKSLNLFLNEEWFGCVFMHLFIIYVSFTHSTIEFFFNFPISKLDSSLKVIAITSVINVVCQGFLPICELSLISLAV